MLTLVHAPALHGAATQFALSDPEGIIVQLMMLQQKTQKRRRRGGKGIRMKGSTRGRKRDKKMYKEEDFGVGER